MRNQGLAPLAAAWGQCSRGVRWVQPRDAVEPGTCAICLAQSACCVNAWIILLPLLQPQPGSILLPPSEPKPGRVWYATTPSRLARGDQLLAREQGVMQLATVNCFFANVGKDASLIHGASVLVFLVEYQHHVGIAWAALPISVQQGYLFPQRGFGYQSKVFSCLQCSAALVSRIFLGRGSWQHGDSLCYV